MSFLNRIKRILLLVRCLMRTISHGAANQIPTNISRIIVVPTGKLGDVICVTPVLCAIRKHWPKAHVIAAGNSKLYRPLLSDSGLVDDYLNLEEKGAISRIKKCQADIALVTGPTFDATALLYIAGVSFIVAPTVKGGVSPYETRLYKIIKKLVKTFVYTMWEYAPRERLRVLEPLDVISDDTSKHLGFSENAERKVIQFLVDNNIDTEKDFIVAVVPSVGHKTKEWPEERFAKVADYLSDVYKAKVILIGGPNDKSKVERTKKLLEHKARAVEVTDFDIDELKALISKLHLFVSVDTGPTYIAEAFGIPTVDIIGPVSEKEQPPRGLLNRNVLPPYRLRPELSVLNARVHNREEALRQVNSITVEAVIREIDLLINDIKRN